MSKRILFFGRGKSGSWRIRGEQLGAAVGGLINATPNDHALEDVDLVVLVKRCYPSTLTTIQSHGLPIVWDVVDSWPQPSGNAWQASTAMSWLVGQLNEIRPVAVVAATAKMANDVSSVFKGPVIWLPHHARQGLVPRPLRPEVRVVGYEGSAHYLGQWQPLLAQWCARNHVNLTIKSEMSLAEYAALDIVVALREVNGYPARNWKSNVKLANAQAAGLPCVVSHEQGYLETVTGGERFVLGPERYELLYQALDSLLPYETRLDVQRQQAAHIVGLDQISQRYETWLHSLKF